MVSLSGIDVEQFVAERLLARNRVSSVFFGREAGRIASLSEEMAERFRRGGRLLAFGRGAAATDAQHIAVEFVHPVIVGKRALPAVDVSSAFTDWIPALAGEADVVAGFAPPGGDAAVASSLEDAAARGALTLALCGSRGDLAVDHVEDDLDPFVNQEVVETLYHTLWETVHVFLEHRPHGQEDLGASGFLYPFLTTGTEDLSNVRSDVASSIRMKAADTERLREVAARDSAAEIAEAVRLVTDRLQRGGTALIFGNGGSATDANDWAIDCVSHPVGPRIRALSLASDPAVLSALSNDIGAEAMFLRQLIAHGRQGDIAIAISTSGGSPSVLAALAEARRLGMATIALLGYDGGEVVRRQLADVPIVVGSDYIPRIQEAQASIYHVMTEAWRRWNP